MFAETIKTETMVIGSGAGGAITAALLAENGFDVLLCEEGPKMEMENFTHSMTEMMERLYRRGGVNPILGSPNIALAEGQCVGGGTVINNAIYHRTPGDIVRQWQNALDIKEFSPDKLVPYFNKIEKDLSVCLSPPDPASELLRAGAEKLGWRGEYVPRAQDGCSNTNLCYIGCPTGAKQSMITTYIPRALKAGAKLLSNCKVEKIITKRKRAIGAVAVQKKEGSQQRILIKANHIFVSGGAIQTPALLKKSGIRKNIGTTFYLHPMIKVLAKFKSELDLQNKAFPTYQLREFIPAILLGGSSFSPSVMGGILHNLGSPDNMLMRDWKKMAIYYSMTYSSGNGSIRNLPLLNDSIAPIYFINANDHKNLSVGIAKLAQVLFEAGAEAVYPDIKGHPALKSIKDSRYYLDSLIPLNISNIYTIHIFSSCPMGEIKEKCAVDSFGKIHGFDNIYINDASILPGPPSVNPQGTIMALAMRNVQKFIREMN